MANRHIIEVMDLTHHSHKPLIIATFLLIIGSAGVFLWYLESYVIDTDSVMVPQPIAQEEATSTLEAEASAEASSPLANPIEGVYRNPFE